LWKLSRNGDYLLDRPITAQIDSKFVERTNTQMATASRLACWWKIFTEFNVQFEHIARQKNIIVDTLLRNAL
jgi:hypothetical protein